MKTRELLVEHFMMGGQLCERVHLEEVLEEPDAQDPAVSALQITTRTPKRRTEVRECRCPREAQRATRHYLRTGRWWG